MAILASGLAAVSLGLLLAGHATLRDFDPTAVVLPVTLAIVGIVIVVHVPRNPLGWLFLSAACVVGIEALGAALAYRALVLHDGPHKLGVWSEWVINWLGGLVFPAGLATIMILLIPNGRLPSRRWRAMLFSAPIIEGVLAFTQMFGPAAMKNAAGVPSVANPLGMRGLPLLSNSTFEAVVWGIGLAYALVATAAPLVRIRGADADERQQLKWIGLPLVVTTVVYAAIAIGPTGLTTAGGGAIGWTIVILGYGTALPIAIAIAILRYRLYSIDSAINRAVVYAILAVFIAVVYLAVASGIGSLIGSKSNLGLSLVATVIVAAGFQPVRERARRLANLVVYGKRATPYEALAQFSDQAAGVVPVDQALSEMARVVAEGTRALVACVWVNDNEILTRVATWPPDAIWPEALSVADVRDDNTKAGVKIVPVCRRDELLGALGVRMRPAESLEPIEIGLLTHLADQAGLFLKNAGLNVELQRSIDDLRASRQRIVRAEDAARRRIERDIHDGAQQHMVALTFELGRAEKDYTAIAGSAVASIADLRLHAQYALDSLRELAHGVYPPLLADRGLGDALQAHTRRVAIDVTIDAKRISRYPREIEAAVYFCVLEALVNTQKHSRARRAEIRLVEEGDELTFSVCDDGDGFEVNIARQAGLGLASMVDRIAAEGGSLVIDSRPGRGTNVNGRLPIAAISSVIAKPERLQLHSANADPNDHRGGQPPGARGRPKPFIQR